MPIALRYPLVELLTAGLYLLAWWRFALPAALILWIFLSLLLAATFIDFDHLIIPDEITLGGAVAGILCSILVPAMVDGVTWWQGLLFSAGGALFGYFLLWGVVELGKWTLGRRRIHSVMRLSLEIQGSELAPILITGEEETPLAELFYRESDRVEASCAWFEIDGERLETGKLLIDGQGLRFGDRSWPYSSLAEVMPIRAEVTELVVPREAMGFGDVKFLACIGAFLGWKGVLFSLFAGSMVGAVVGIMMMIVTRGRSGGRIPFGPYLALGAVLWVFLGPQLFDLYGSWARGEAGTFFLLPSR